MTSSGASAPVQSLNWTAACATSIERPPTVAQPASRASRSAQLNQTVKRLHSGPGVRVVAAQFVAFDDDGVDRADLRGLRLDPIELRNDGGFVRRGDAQAAQVPRKLARARARHAPHE